MDMASMFEFTDETGGGLRVTAATSGDSVIIHAEHRLIVDADALLTIAGVLERVATSMLNGTNAGTALVVENIKNG